jgi:hypothetical protein
LASCANRGNCSSIARSGHLVSLDVRRNKMSKHAMPERFGDGDPFGVAPDSGLIGYTDASLSQNKVGVLAPARNAVPVYPVYDSAERRVITKPGITTDVQRDAGFAYRDRDSSQHDKRRHLLRGSDLDAADE